MAELKYATVDILREETVDGTVYTPQQRIIPESAARKLVEMKAAVIIKPNMTDEEIIQKETRTVAAAEKQADK